MGLGGILGEHQWKPACPTFGSCVLRSWGLDLYAGWLKARMASHLPSHHPSLPTTSESGQQMLLFVIYTLRRKCSTLQGRREFCRLALSNRKGKTVKVWKWPWMGLYKWSAAYSIFIFRVRMIWMLGRAKRKDLDNIHLYSLRRQDKKLRSPRYNNMIQ